MSSTTLLDTNQVTRIEHDEIARAKKVTIVNTEMAIEISAEDGDNAEVRPMAMDTIVLFDGIDATQNCDSESINILNYKGFFVSIVWSNIVDYIHGTTIGIEASADGINYHRTENFIALHASLGSESFNIKDAYYKFFRLSYNKGMATSGSITAKAIVKG